MKKRMKKTARQALLLLLVMLFTIPALPAFAAEDLSSQVSAEAPAPEEGDTPSAPEEDGEEPEEPEEPEPEEPGGDGDIPEEDPSVNALPLLVTGGHDTYLSGYAGALFKPENNMKRGEVAYMMYNLLAAKLPVSSSQFSDVDFSSWWGPAINCVAAAGAFNGKGNGLFDPNASITRAEFVTALSNCFGLEEGTADFPDVPEEHWAYRYIASAVAKGWINGFSDGTFGPDRPITRCQAVTIMNSALGRRDDSFATDRAEQKFYDVPEDHWAYLEIAEAAEPVEPMVPDDHPFKVNDKVRVTADIGLNVRAKPNGSIITTVANGAILTVTETSQWPWIGIKTSGGTAGYVHSDYVEKYDGNNNNNTGSPVSGTGATLSSGSVSLHQYQSLRLDASVSASGMTWSSSDPNVAVVGYTVAYNSSGSEYGAMIYGKNPGTTISMSINCNLAFAFSLCSMKNIPGSVVTL